MIKQKYYGIDEPFEVKLKSIREKNNKNKKIIKTEKQIRLNVTEC